MEKVGGMADEAGAEDKVREGKAGASALWSKIFKSHLRGAQHKAREAERGISGYKQTFKVRSNSIELNIIKTRTE